MSIVTTTTSTNSTATQSSSLPNIAQQISLKLTPANFLLWPFSNNIY
ncbi:hypothetical protein CCACVL1_04149 [Corchorus capsularis]|uniref:Uncharacterized protein n=1 Tax=Corchorus capsularis TaxID=210143 RepID=A0A1R3JV43_COCAP|nr:hypothetical protein CCACVL1_04149 [Corchorus capsularis]